MSESHECKYCHRPQPLTAFCGNRTDRRRAQKGRPACCAECATALQALKRQASTLQQRERWCEEGEEDRVSAFTSPEGVVTSDVLQLYLEQAVHSLVNDAECGYDCSGSDSWLPGMLSRWLANRLQHPHSAAPRAAVSAEARAAPAWLQEMRAERVLCYDTAAFPFDRIFRDLFETSDLAALHREKPREDRAPLCPTLFRAYVNAGIKRPSTWKRSTKWEATYVGRFRQSEQYNGFMETYHRFIKQVVVPLVGCGELMYQCPPTLRCQMPSPVPSCSPHRDSDYAAHHGAEINFWIPVTQAWGSNSLHVESEPGKQDFHPLVLGPGEMAIFNGSQCVHFTEANSTDSVRCSFDFRVIPKSLLKDSSMRLASKRHDTRGAATYQYEFLSTEIADAQ